MIDSRKLQMVNEFVIGLICYRKDFFIRFSDSIPRFSNIIMIECNNIRNRNFIKIKNRN